MNSAKHVVVVAFNVRLVPPREDWPRFASALLRVSQSVSDRQSRVVVVFVADLFSKEK